MSDPILNALDQINGKLDKQTEALGQHGERLRAIEVKMDAVMDGEEGRLPKLENKVEGMSNKIYFFTGAGAALSSAIHWLFPHKG